MSRSGKTSKVNQECFHQDFKLPEDNGIGDRRVTLLDRADKREDLNRK